MLQLKKRKGKAATMMDYLYVMISRTDTRMGRLIRTFTGEEYNHVSLCLNDNLQQFVSFARYRLNVPLAGGYVTESIARFSACGRVIPVRIFRLKITQEDANKLSSLFQMADHTTLVYNSLGALLQSCHLRCSIPGAYTCLEFAGAILGETYPSIQSLSDALAPWEIYRGDLFEIMQFSPDHKSRFLQKRGFRRGTQDTISHFRTLLWRLLRLERPDDPISACKINIRIKNIPQGSV